MPINKKMRAELQHEATNTKKVLERVPTDHFEWAPHLKSFTLGRLAAHVAELPRWIAFIMNADEMNLAIMNSTAIKVTNSTELIQSFEYHIEKAVAILQNDITDEVMVKNRAMKQGDKVLFTLPKFVALRSMVLSHIIHHRAQLGVYLRLPDIPVPGIYGPPADEERF